MIPGPVYESTLRTFLAPIVPLLDDDGVTEVLVNGPDTVFVERKGRLERTLFVIGIRTHAGLDDAMLSDIRSPPRD